MRILDRYTEKILNADNLPDHIELGRYAFFDGKSFKEITSNTFKVHYGQRIHQELLDDVNKDKHDIFEIISESVKNGDFKSVPLLQGIKSGIEFGKFATKLEENIFHIEAIFHSPYAKLNRAIDKVPVSRAKRISNRSNQYLAAHTEDWLHKGLVSFRPSRILTEEIISDTNVYENQLLIALVTKAARYLQRKVRHTRDISQFLKEYKELMSKEQHHLGWYKRVRRELELAGEVYDEEDGNYKAEKDTKIVTSTMKRLKKLRDALSKLRRYDLFNDVDQRLVRTVQYHDTNVLKNDKHYRYLKDLWFLLLKEYDEDDVETKADKDENIINNVRNYGISLINYAVKDQEYLGYYVVGKDTEWYASRTNCPDMQLLVKKDGIIHLSIGTNVLKFIVTCGKPYLSNMQEFPKDTYIIAYENQDADDVHIRSYVNKDPIIPVSLNDITSVERVAIILRKEMLKQYVENILLKNYNIPRTLTPFFDIISKSIGCIRINKREATYTFERYPIMDYHTEILEGQILKDGFFKGKKSLERKRISTDFSRFMNEYFASAKELYNNLKCFNMDCCQQINRWECNSLSYICCSCGYVLDSIDHNHIKFYKKDSPYSPEEMGMDYLEISINK